MNNGITKTLPICVYQIMYLNKLLLPYESFLDNTLNLISTLSIPIVLLFL